MLIDKLEQFNFISVVLRLFVAVIFSGILGIEREDKRRPAGFRTYLLVCLGAAMAMILGQYEYAYMGMEVERFDVTRIGAQVINGIGFLGVGTIIVTDQQEIKGLTTAAGLWATASMGLAIGAGNLICAFLGFVMILLSFRLFPRLEKYFSDNSRHMSIYMEFITLSDIHQIVTSIKQHQIDICDMEMIDKEKSLTNQPAMLFALYLRQKQNHKEIMAHLSEFECVVHIDEI
jgi:Uncharacterized membrane protein